MQDYHRKRNEPEELLRLVRDGGVHLGRLGALDAGRDLGKHGLVRDARLAELRNEALKF